MTETHLYNVFIINDPSARKVANGLRPSYSACNVRLLVRRYMNAARDHTTEPKSFSRMEKNAYLRPALTLTPTSCTFNPGIRSKG
jgi:hypothetical protein